MNKKQYEHAHKTAEHLHGKVRDLIDDANHHLGREALERCHKLIQDIRSQKNPRTLESSAKDLVRHFEAIKNHGDQVMDFHHSDFFINGYQGLVMDLRKFDNY